MAKLTVWLGSTDTNWEVQGNWTNSTPATGDVVKVSKEAVNDIAVNTDRRDDNTGTGLDLHSFVIEEGCPANVGTSGNPLRGVGCNALNPITSDSDSVMVHRGTGKLFLQVDGGNTSGNQVVRTLVIDAQNDGSIADIKTGSTSTGGAIGDVVCLHGIIDIDGNADLTNLILTRSVVNRGSRGPTVTITSGTDILSNCYVDRGKLTTANGVTLLHVNGGLIVFDASGKTMDTVRQYGGEIKFIAGNINSLTGIRGRFDARQLKNTVTLNDLARSRDYEFLAPTGLITIGRYVNLTGDAIGVCS